MRTSSCIAVLALRMRVSMSAMGSVSIGSSSPARLGQPGDLARVGHLPQADAAQPELAVDRTRPAAATAAGVPAHLELRRGVRLVDQRLLGHVRALLLPLRRGALAAAELSAALLGLPRVCVDLV